MRVTIGSVLRLLFVAAIGSIAVAAAPAHARDFKFEAQLVWAADTETSPDPKHSKVSDDVLKRLLALNLKWKNYFLVRKVQFTVPAGETKSVELSDSCKISVKDINGKNFEFGLTGKGESVLKRTQALENGNMLVLGGNAPNSTAWMVVIKRVE